MLRVEYITDNNILEPLYAELFGGDCVSGVNAVLIEDDQYIGVCTLEISDEVTFRRFAIKKEKDDFARRDFLFRVVLFKLSMGDYVVTIPIVDSNLIKFGFVTENGKMKINSKDIEFPSYCHK